jgi:hypothetical protein
LPIFINLAVHFHLGAARFCFCRGETGAFAFSPENAFGKPLRLSTRCENLSPSTTYFLRFRTLLIREMISSGPAECRADSSAAYPRIYVKSAKALASMSL